MEKLKLISFRIDLDVLRAIDDYCISLKCLNRSQFINAALKAVATCSTHETLLQIVEIYDPYSAGYTLRMQKEAKKYALPDKVQADETENSIKFQY